jgi:hypothetical protein
MQTKITLINPFDLIKEDDEKKHGVLVKKTKRVRVKPPLKVFKDEIIYF